MFSCLHEVDRTIEGCDRAVRIACTIPGDFCILCGNSRLKKGDSSLLPRSWNHNTLQRSHHLSSGTVWLENGSERYAPGMSASFNCISALAIVL